MSDVTRLPVRGASPYDVVVGGPDVVDLLPGLVGDRAERVAVIHDGDLTGLSALPRTKLMEAGYEVVGIPLVPGEQAKSYTSAESCWEQLGAAGFTRSDVVVTMGGGATTDLGGFVAATWLRGVRVIHLPTTLLAMVDAAVGGKTGINTGAGKNLVGSFHEPAGVLCDLDLLASLPYPELVAGLGEVVKCGFIADPEILALVERFPADALEPRSRELRELVERAIAVKIAVVEADLEETGAGGGIGREVLNYGHTMAHAIEKSTAYSVRHGEAVALGMVYVAELARLAGRLDDDTAKRHESVLASVGLPTRFAGATFEELHDAMRVDKKARGSQLRFVVLDGIGRPGILADPSEEHLRAAYEHLAGQ
ncbi:MAG TPA: 3-dehydroquinate synthase [Marmoricola sp.]|nr:3-dehydroquinate synthase [Marmoricola sp.]